MAFDFDKMDNMSAADMIANNYDETLVTYINQLLVNTIESQKISLSSFFEFKSVPFYYKDQKICCRSKGLNIPWITRFFKLCESIKKEHDINIMKAIPDMYLDKISIMSDSGIDIDVMCNKHSYILDTTSLGFKFNFDHFRIACQYLNWFFKYDDSECKRFSGLELFSNPYYYVSVKHIVEIMYMFAYDTDKNVSQVCDTFHLGFYFFKLFLNTIQEIFQLENQQMNEIMKMLYPNQPEDYTLREGSFYLLKFATGLHNSIKHYGSPKLIAAFYSDIDNITPVDIETLISNIKEKNNENSSNV